MLSRLIVLFFASLVVAQICNTKGTCEQCALLGSGCGWCDAIQQCVEGTPAGPAEGACLGMAWITNGNNCPVCADRKSCFACTEYPNCCWNGGTCEPASAECRETSGCPCDEARKCSDCLGVANCKWCPELAPEAQCIPTGSPCSMPATTCPCDGLICDTCVEENGCVWCSNTQGQFSCKTQGTQGCTPVASCDNYCLVWGAGSCEVCNSIAGCGWCGTDSKCHAEGYTSCDLEPFCTSQCAIMDTCSGCQALGACSWCPLTKECVATGDFPQICAGQPIVHTCAPPPGPTKGGFSVSSFFGGFFLVVGVAVVGAVVLFFVRRR